MTSAGWNSEQVATLTTGVLGVAGLAFLAVSVYGSWKAHSVKGIITSAAAVPGTQIVTQPAIAADTPVNVSSNAEAKVVTTSGAPVAVPGGH